MDDRTMIAAMAMQGLMAFHGGLGKDSGEQAVACADSLLAALGNPSEAPNSSIVIPAAEWEQIVAYCTAWMAAHHCEGRCADCDEDDNIRAIIASVKEANDE